MKKAVLVWDNDIGWCERLQKELAKEGVPLLEADSREALQGHLQEGECFAAVLSLELLLECQGGHTWEAEPSGICQNSNTWEAELSGICQNSRVPVFLLSDRAGEAYELAALRAGASDYASREKDIRIVAARLQTRFLAGKREEGFQTDYPDILEKRSERLVQIGQREILLTPKEACVLHCFLHRKGEILSREEILSEAWEEKKPKSGRVVDTIIKQLRRKIKETQYAIRSEYKLGYRFDKD